MSTGFQRGKPHETKVCHEGSHNDKHKTVNFDASQFQETLNAETEADTGLLMDEIL